MTQTLVIAAHPDDEVLGCGATLARLTKRGDQVKIAILGEGITSRFAKQDEVQRSAIKSLQAQSLLAGRCLGINDIIHHQLPDNQFDTIPLLQIVKIIEELISNFRPTVIFTHHGADLNIDHSIVHRAVLTATRPIPNQPVKDIYAFEIPSSTEWYFQKNSSFHPNVFFDVEETLELKLQALECYQSEMREFPHPRSLQAVQTIAERWGSVVGIKAVEAFELIRSIR